MLTCEFCGAENSDYAKHCSACSEPLTAEAAREDIRQTEAKARSALAKKKLVYGALAAVIFGGLAFAGIRSLRRGQLKKEARAFYSEYAESAEVTLGFWKCITRGDKAPKSNVELESGLEQAIAKSNGDYVRFASTKCMPLLDSAPKKLESLTPPDFLADAWAGYLSAVKVLGKDAEAYVASVAVLEQDVPRDAQVAKLAGSYHAGGESADSRAYDRFLRCAVPGFAKMTDEQQLLEYLAKAMKDPAPHVERWRKDCYPIIEKTQDAKAHPDYKKKAAAFAADDRDVQAFQDVLKAANRKARRAAHAPFEQAWYRFAQAQQALADEFAKYLSD